MKKKNVLILAASLISLPTLAFDGSLSSGQGTESIYATYKCNNKMEYFLDIEFNNKMDNIVVTYKNESKTIPLVKSADGAKYSDGKSVYWFKGESLKINDKVTCEAVEKLTTSVVTVKD